MSRPKNHDILLKSLPVSGVQPAYSVELWKTDKPIVPKAGYGGHPLAARPKRAALTVFEGRQPFQLEAQLYLFHNHESVQEDREHLEAMAIAPFKGYKTRPEPPRVEITDKNQKLLPPMPRVGPYFWVEDLAWEDEYRHNDWTLYFNVVTITLLEAINDETLQEASTAGSLTSTRHLYIVKRGDTLHSIAAKELGNAKLWKKISELNGIRSDGQLAKYVGKEIKLP